MHSFNTKVLFLTLFGIHVMGCSIKSDRGISRNLIICAIYYVAAGGETLPIRTPSLSKKHFTTTSNLKSQSIGW